MARTASTWPSRFLCPNCHSQTRNFAGRSKHRSPAGPVPRPSGVQPEAGDGAGSLTVTGAAGLLGCSTSHFYPQRQLKDGTREGRPEPQTLWAQIIRCALAFPEEGPREIAARLSTLEFGGLGVPHGTVSNVLTAAGPNRATGRATAGKPLGKTDHGAVDSVDPAGVAEW
jgi:hypothetical protein